MKGRSSKLTRAELERRLAEVQAKNVQLGRTLQMIEEARAALADQYDFAPLGFVTLDAKGCIREMNLTAARLLDRERSHLLTMPFLMCVAKTSSRIFLQHLKQCRHEQGEVVNEMTLRRGRRLMRPVELRSVPVLDARRGDTVYRTAITDTSERLAARLALQQSEERYRAVVELSPDGIFVVIDGVIVFANRTALGYCGVEEAPNLVGRNFVDLVRPIYRQKLIADLLRTVPAGMSSPVEVKLDRVDGARVDVEVAARDFVYEGARAVLVVARDIRLRRKAESQVLAISEREKSRFGRDLHDGLCQSLGGAACLAEALRNRFRQAGSDAAASAEEIATLVRECMQEARNLARGLNPVAMEKHGLVSALHELASEVTRRAGITCAVRCHDPLAIHDTNVATNLYRIAQEAIANAIQHGGAKSVLIDLTENGGNATLRLRNDGKAFPARPKETGMGLYTMRYRAAMIGGSLELHRDGTRGTVVTCSFPTNGHRV